MSQLADFTLTSLTDQDNSQIPIQEYLDQMNLINTALEQVKGKSTTNPMGFPDYFDDILKELIDAVPLE